MALETQLEVDYEDQFVKEKIEQSEKLYAYYKRKEKWQKVKCIVLYYLKAIGRIVDYLLLSIMRAAIVVIAFCQLLQVEGFQEFLEKEYSKEHPECSNPFLKEKGREIYGCK